MYRDVMSLSKFLSRYVQVKGVDLNHVKHDEVKFLFPFLKRASFDEIKYNRELIYSGKVILVSDGKKTIPYYVPQLEMDVDYEYDEFERQNALTNIVDDKYYDYSSMSEYELRQLLRRKFNSRRNQKEAKKELLSRGIELKKTHKK